MNTTRIINIAEDFSSTPGARYRTDGEFSGEEFFEEILKNKFKEAVENDSVLTIILDGTHGYATSFLDEAFGSLVEKEKFTIGQTDKFLELVSNEEPYLIGEIRGYLKDRARQMVSSI